MRPTKKKAAKAKKTIPLTLIQAVYAIVKGYNFETEYAHTKGKEAVALYPKNAFAEKIVVQTSRFDEGETNIEMYRIWGGEKYVSLSFVSIDGGKTESAALALIKAELKRYC